MNWPFKRRPRPIQVIARDRLELTLAEWRTDPHLVSIGLRLVNNPDMKLALDVLTNSGPENDVFPANAPDWARAAKQAQIEGYRLALNNLRALARLEQMPVDVPSDFGVEEPPVKL